MGTAGDYYLDENDKGIKTGTDYRFYQLSAAFPEFSNEGKDLVFQFSIKSEQRLDCGGGYLKLLPPGFDQENFNGDTNDNIEKKAGSLLEDWDFLPPQQIDDPSISKPADWVDEATMSDPDAVKPDGWDDIPQFIADPDAEQPGDWDTELDGDWEAPLVPNSDYEGEWEAPIIPNPAYKGPWVQPQIDNPDYKVDNEIYKFTSAGVGIEIWQVKAGSIFDNILVTDSASDAEAAAKKIVELRDAEKD